MPEPVRIVETLRDAWQGLPRPVPTAHKLAFAERLLEAGFPRLDIGSFVSRARVPAMADTGEVLARLRLPEMKTRPGITALVANEKGLERLLAAPHVDEVLFPFSLSEAFQRRNTKLGREEACALVGTLARRVHAAGRRLYVTVSMAFGNNEGEPFDPAELREWVARLHAAGADRLGLADTTAVATPATIRSTWAAVMAGSPAWPVPGAHLHVTEDNQAEMVAAALDAGVRDFDSALGGLGGCQFAKGAVSNVSTWPLVRQLLAAGLEPDVPVGPLAQLDETARRIAAATRQAAPGAAGAPDPGSAGRPRSAEP